MKQFLLFFSSLLILLPGILFGQNEMEGIERRLVDLYQDIGALSKEDPDRAREKGIQFKEEIKLALESDKDMVYPFENLGKLIQILRPENGAIRVFSWSVPTKTGTKATSGFAQFWTIEGFTKVQDLDKSLNEANAGALWHAIHALPSPTGDKYLILGWGNTRPDFQHRSARILVIEGTELIDCRKCFAGKTFVEVHAPASEEIALTYDPFNKVMRHPEYKLNEINGSYRATGKVISYFWKNGLFIPAP